MSNQRPLRRWSPGIWVTIVAGAFVLGIIDGLQTGWERAVRTTSFVVLVFAQVAVLSDLVLSILHRKRFGVRVLIGILATLLYLGWLVLTERYTWMFVHSALSLLLTATTLLFALRSSR